MSFLVININYVSRMFERKRMGYLDVLEPVKKLTERPTFFYRPRIRAPYAVLKYWQWEYALTDTYCGN
jgi:hypothetical protein